MVKTLLKTILLTSLAFTSYAQFPATRQNAPLVRAERYVTNSPTNTIGNSKMIEYTKDSTDHVMFYPQIGYAMYNSTRNDGYPTSIAWFDNNGYFRRSPLPSWITGINSGMVSSALGYTPYSASNPSGYISSFTETDPIWNAQKSSYSTKTVADALYKSIGYAPAWTDVTGKPTFFSGSFLDLTSKPTTLAGYNISDAYPLIGNPSGFLTTVPWSIITSKPSFATVATSGSYTDLTNKPITKRQESYSGATNSSGLYTVTYPTAYSSVPNVQFQIGTGGSNKETILLTSSTTTGFTVYVQLRADVLGLLPTYSNVNGRNVSVLVTEI